MRLLGPWKQAISMLVLALLALPLPALAQTPAAAAAPVTPPVVDVSLTQGGTLQGYVVDGQGVPAQQVEVVLSTAQGTKVATQTDPHGRFSYRGLTGGSYQLETSQGVVVCRAWAPKTAPPQSAATLLVVHDDQLARGQWHPGAPARGVAGLMKRAAQHPFTFAAIIGAAIAIPVAIHNADDDDAS